MRSPADRLREALEAWRRDEAAERVARWRGARGAAGAREVADRHDWLRADEAHEALAEARDAGLLSADEHAALRAHLARAAGEAELAEARDRLRQVSRTRVTEGHEAMSIGAALDRMLGAADPRGRDLTTRALEQAAARVGSELLDARARADEAAARVLGGAPRHPDAGPEDDSILDAARAVLAATDDAATESTAWALRGVPSAGDPRWDALAVGLRRRELDGLWVPAGRWRRIAAPLAALGLGREITARLRTEPSHGGIDPRVRIAVVDAPRDVRLAPSAIELGLVSELAGAEAVGRALLLALVAPALPVETRRPAVGTPARAFGVLFAQLLGDVRFLRRARGLDPREAEEAARTVRVIALLDLRLAAAAVIARREPAGSGRERNERASELLRRALRVEVPPALAILIARTPSAVAARFRARHGALAWAQALRERHDEDWFRNPRAAEQLRASGARGGLLSIEAWCEELGAGDDAVRAGLRELVP